jgi:hypothetical protein
MHYLHKFGLWLRQADGNKLPHVMPSCNLNQFGSTSSNTTAYGTPVSVQARRCVSSVSTFRDGLALGTSMHWIRS